MAFSAEGETQEPVELAPLLERLSGIYGPDVSRQIRASLVESKRVAWLANPLVPAERLPAGEPVPGLPGCFALPHQDRPALMAHPAVEAGSAYPTNPSSVVAARALKVLPGQEVLDLGVPRNPGKISEIWMSGLFVRIGR